MLARIYFDLKFFNLTDEEEAAYAPYTQGKKPAPVTSAPHSIKRERFGAFGKLVDVLTIKGNILTFADGSRLFAYADNTGGELMPSVSKPRRWKLVEAGIDPFTKEPRKARSFRKDHAYYCRIIDRLQRMPNRPRGVWVEGQHFPQACRLGDWAFKRYAE